MKGNAISFAGYVSRWKASALMLIWTLGLCAFVLGDSSGVTYHKWLFYPKAFPMRLFVIAVGFYGIYLILRIVIVAFSGKPAIKVCGGAITMNYGKRGHFSISEIDEIGNIFNGDYYIKVDNRRYGVSIYLCSNIKMLRIQMQVLQREFEKQGVE